MKIIRFSATNGALCRVLRIFVLLVAIMVGGCNKAAKNAEEASREKNAIERVLAESLALTVQMDADWGLKERYWSASEVVLEFAQGLDGVDLSGCPIEFKHAYKAHASAWHAAYRIEETNTGVNGFIARVIDQRGIKTALDDAKVADANIANTWLTIQHIAISHGIDL